MPQFECSQQEDECVGGEAEGGTDRYECVKVAGGSHLLGCLDDMDGMFQTSS